MFSDDGFTGLVRVGMGSLDWPGFYETDTHILNAYENKRLLYEQHISQLKRYPCDWLDESKDGSEWILHETCGLRSWIECEGGSAQDSQKGKDFLQILQDNWQAQIAGYYNHDKTDEERKIRNAVIQEYVDLIAIYKANVLPSTPSLQVLTKELKDKVEGEAELRYPVKTSLDPETSPYKESQITFCHGVQFGLSLQGTAEAAGQGDGGWISLPGNEPEQYSSIEVKDKYGKIFDGGYYQENGKVCINLPNKNVNCYDLEENFTHYRQLPNPLQNKGG